MSNDPYDLSQRMPIRPREISRSVEKRLLASMNRNLATMGGNQTMLRQLKQFVEDQADTETMIALSVFAKGMRAEYEARNISVPEWLDDRIRQIGRALEASTRDAKELRLKEIAAEETRLLTGAEKREKLKAEREKLETELQGTK